MPKTAKGKEIMKNMKKTYGANAERVFYASKNKGTIKGVDKPRKRNKRSTKHA
jgi:hypothetical protein